MSESEIILFASMLAMLHAGITVNRADQKVAAAFAWLVFFIAFVIS